MERRMGNKKTVASGKSGQKKKQTVKTGESPKGNQPGKKQMSPRRIAFDVEVTNQCNSACVMCPRGGMKRPQGMMSEDTFYSLMQQAEELASKWEVIAVGFSGAGECLLHPSLPEFLRHVKMSLGVKTCITTNGLLLDGQMTSRLLEAEVNEVFISVHGIGKHYDRICEGGNFDVVAEHVKWFVKTSGKRVHTVIVAVETNLNREHVNSAEFLKYWKDMGADHVEIQKCRTYAGHLNNPAVMSPPPARRPGECRLFLPFQFITWNGDLLSCCFDLDAEMPIGNIADSPLKQLLKKKERIGNPKNSFARCRECLEDIPEEKMEMESFGDNEQELYMP